MQAFGSIWRTTRLSLILTASVLASACENSQEPLIPDAPEEAAAGSGAKKQSAKKDSEDAKSSAASKELESDWCGVHSTLQAACTSCHNEQKVAGAPMSLLTFEDLHKPAVSDKSRKVYELVKERIHDEKRPMPPQKRLSDEQLASIDAWIDSGALAGDGAKCAATAPQKATGAASFEWPENCDETYRITAHAQDAEDAPFMVGPGEEIHPQVYVDAPWGEDAVQAIAWRSITDNARVLHHWILYGANREFLVGWAPGKDGALMKEDVGMLMVGGKLRLDMHYNNLGNEESEADKSGVELCIVKKDKFRENTATVAQMLGAFQINLPPNSTNVDVTSTCTLNSDQPVTLLTTSPHAHRMAKHMKFTLERADGEKIVMHDQSFNFEEQGQFDLEQPLVVNKGDKLITTCTYDNDTDKTVTFGEDTGNEMCFNFALYYPQGALKCTFSQ